MKRGCIMNQSSPGDGLPARRRWSRYRGGHRSGSARAPRDGSWHSGSPRRVSTCQRYGSIPFPRTARDRRRSRPTAPVARPGGPQGSGLECVLRPSIVRPRFRSPRQRCRTRAIRRTCASDAPYLDHRIRRIIQGEVLSRVFGCARCIYERLSRSGVRIKAAAGS